MPAATWASSALVSVRAADGRRRCRGHDPPAPPRRGSGAARAARWLAWAAGVIASLYLLAIVVNPIGASETWQNWAGIVAADSFTLIPITIGIAVLRYRLFDIDFVIRKTVVIAVVVAFIAFVYVAVVAGVGAVVGVRGAAAALGSGGGHRGAGLPACSCPSPPPRRPCRLREAGDALRGDDLVRRSAGRHVRIRRRPAATGTGPRGGGGRRPCGGLARGRRRASPGRDLARRRGPRRA